MKRHVSLWIYFAIAFLQQWNTSLATDDSAKWIEPQLRFWLISSGGAFVQGLLAIKMVMSDAFMAPALSEADRKQIVKEMEK